MNRELNRCLASMPILTVLALTHGCASVEPASSDSPQTVDVGMSQAELVLRLDLTPTHYVEIWEDHPGIMSVKEAFDPKLDADSRPLAHTGSVVTAVGIYRYLVTEKVDPVIVEKLTALDLRVASFNDRLDSSMAPPAAAADEGNEKHQAFRDANCNVWNWEGNFHQTIVSIERGSSSTHNWVADTSLHRSEIFNHGGDPRNCSLSLQHQRWNGSTWITVHSEIVPRGQQRGRWDTFKWARTRAVKGSGACLTNWTLDHCTLLRFL